MMDDEKPFKCPKCSQCFATSDHLVVHQRMHAKENHDLLVKIPAGSSEHASDQTPTPTRFLKTADVDDSVLFEEINPFDQDFKLASKRHVSPAPYHNASAISSTVEEGKTKRDSSHQSCESSSKMQSDGESSKTQSDGETEVSSSTVEGSSRLRNSTHQEVKLKEKSKKSSVIGHNQISSSTSEDQTECTVSTLEECKTPSKTQITKIRTFSVSNQATPSCSSTSSCSSTVEESGVRNTSSPMQLSPNPSIIFRTSSSASVSTSVNTVIASSSSSTTKQTIVSSTNDHKQNTQTSLQSLLQQIRKQTQTGDGSVKPTPVSSSGTLSQEALREQLKSLIKSGQIKIKFTSDPSSPKVQATIVGNIAKKTTVTPRPTVVSNAQPTEENGVQQLAQKRLLTENEQSPQNEQLSQTQQLPPKLQLSQKQPFTQKEQLPQQQQSPKLQLPQKQPPKAPNVIHIKPKQAVSKPIPIAPKEVTTTSDSSKSVSIVSISPMSVLSIPASTVSSNSWQVQTHSASSLAFAKQKLKHVIQQNASNGTENTLINGRVSMVTSASSQGKYKDIFLDADLNHADCENYEHGGKRKGRLNEDCSPEEKRQRFLERNRAAASRCRQKRKIWVNQLETKSDDLIQTNNLLMNEINALRSEVAQLKALLLAHKDCPVTLQQKALLGQMTPGSYVAAVSDGQIIAIHQVPNGNIQQASSAEEVASSALTDMAARATIELGNHATPGSVTVQSTDGAVSTVGSTLLPP